MLLLLFYVNIIIMWLSFTLHVIEGKLQYTGMERLARPDHSMSDLSSIIPYKGRLLLQSQDNTVARWTQMYNNIPVYGSRLTTHHNAAGGVVQYEGHIAHSISLNAKPAIQPSDAVIALKKHLGHNMIPDVKSREDNPILYIIPNESGDKLVWKVCFYFEAADKDPVHTLLIPAYIIGFVDAHTGRVLRTWNQLSSVRVVGIVGNVITGSSYKYMEVNKEGQLCSHVDKNRRIVVQTLRNKIQLSEATATFECSLAKQKDWDSLLDTGGYSPRNEAFIHAQQFVDLWTKLNFGCYPHKNETSKLRLIVHPGERYENAFFNGEYFVFGDGADMVYPLTSLDVICHELGHAVTQWHGGDMEYNGEAGSINEAYSDILGETCDMYYNGKKNFLIGEEITKNQTAIRNMCYPEKHGGLSHYKQYRDKMDIHNTSGIYSRVWCILSKKTGWNYLKAFKVFTRANLFYWWSTMTMHCGACGVESAAKDLHLKRSDVISAFHLVGLRCSQC